MLSRTVAELSQLIVQILDTLLFKPPFGGGGSLGTTYDVHLGLIAKAYGLPIKNIVIIELFP